MQLLERARALVSASHAASVPLSRPYTPGQRDRLDRDNNAVPSDGAHSLLDRARELVDRPTLSVPQRSPMPLPYPDRSRGVPLSRDKAMGQRDSWDSDDWRAYFDERAGIIEFDGGLARYQAEDRAFECCIAEWLNRHPQQSDSGRCKSCGKTDRDGHVVVPFGTVGHRHTWLHPECWSEWHEARRRQAHKALALLGIEMASPD